jgi:myb proto-oncogene protein
MEQERYGFIGGGDSLDQSLWNEENIWFLQQQLM